MKPALTCMSVLALLVCAVPATATVISQRDAHPIVGVIDLLKGLIAQSETEGKNEAINYMKFSKWCVDSIKTLDGAIAEEKETIEELKSKIEGYNKDADFLDNQISELTKEISNLDTAAGTALSARNEENSRYLAADADYTSTISSIDQAIASLLSAGNTTHTMLLAQRTVKTARALVTSLATDKQLNVLDAFMAQGHQQDTASAPAPAFSFAPAPRPKLEGMGDSEDHVKQYEFKSEGVTDLLKEMKYKFETEKLEASKAETNAVNAYNLAKQARDAAKSAAEQAKQDATNDLGDVKSDRKQAKTDLGNEQGDLGADQGTLQATKSSCTIKKKEWDDRSAIRASELEAMQVAIKILAKVTGVRTEAPSNPVPPTSPVFFQHQKPGLSFLQVVNPKMKAINLLRAAAHTAHSRALERLAQEISVHLTGPFDQVNNMIEKMIFRLMNEQTDEDNHKLWCDKELKKTLEQKSNKEAKIEDLSAKITALKATSLTLKNQIEAADTMISDIIAHMKEATEIREAGKKENQLAIKDAVKAQKALAEAIATLESFYKESGMIAKKPFEFVQAPVTLDPNPNTWDKSYTGVTDPTVADPTTTESGEAGVIAVLKANVEKFATMEGDTRNNEAQDQKLYEEDMKANKIEKAKRTTESETKTAEQKRQLDKIASLDKSEKHTDGELQAVDQYFKDLQPACVSGDSTYDLRKAARKKEMDALRQAQVILRDAFAAK